MKNHGSLRTAQATAKKRSGVTAEKLLYWHRMVEETPNELGRLSSWHDEWEGIIHSKKIDSFLGNMDETNISAANGILLLSM